MKQTLNSMKLLILTAALLVIASTAVQADVYIQWQAAAGFYFTADPASGFLGAGQSALAQLIWRPNNTGLNAGTDAAVVGGNYVSGDDVWLTDFLITEGVDTSEWGDFGAGIFTDGGSQPAGGFVYARIFESDNIVLGTRYYVGPVISANDLDSSDPLVVPQPYQMNRDLTDGDAIDGAFGFQVVPEPGTIAMLALGIMTLGGAAHKRRKAAIVEA